METQRELVFHESLSLPSEQLEKGRKKAVRQKDIILSIFKGFPDFWLTPYEIQSLYHQKTDELILITSVRRSITDLTNDGITGHGSLIKGSRDKQKVEKYHTNNNRWKYNPNPVAPLNPKK